MERRRGGLSNLIGWTFAVLAGVAVYRELQKPPEERTWHGRIGAYVPYDFRMPTAQRIRDAYWNPGSDRIFTDRVLGVGWAINLPALWRFVQHKAQSGQSQD